MRGMSSLFSFSRLLNIFFYIQNYPYSKTQCIGRYAAIDRLFFRYSIKGPPVDMQSIDLSAQFLGRRLDGMYVYTYSHIYSKSVDQPGKIANPARGQLNR